MKYLVLLFLCFGAVVSCSRVSVVTRYADTLIWWEVDRLVDFTADKRQTAKAEVDKMYQMVAETSFPVLANSFSKLPDQVDSGKPLEELPCVEDMLKAFASLPLMLRSSTEIMVGLLGPREYQNLVSNYRQKIEQETENLDKQKREQIETYQDIIEYFIGDLTPEQESLVKEFYAVESYPYEQQLENKKHNLELVEMTQGDPKKLRRLARDFFTVDSSVELADFKKARSQFFSKISRLTSKIIFSMSEKQKKKLRKNSLELSEDLRSLVARN